MLEREREPMIVTASETDALAEKVTAVGLGALGRKLGPLRGAIRLPL